MSNQEVNYRRLYNLLNQASDNLNIIIEDSEIEIDFNYIQLVAAVIVKSFSYLKDSLNLKSNQDENNQDSVDLYNLLCSRDEDGIIYSDLKTVKKILNCTYSIDIIDSLFKIFKLNDKIIELEYQIDSLYVGLNDVQVSECKSKLSKLIMDLDKLINGYSYISGGSYRNSRSKNLLEQTKTSEKTSIALQELLQNETLFNKIKYDDSGEYSNDIDNPKL